MEYNKTNYNLNDFSKKREKFSGYHNIKKLLELIPNEHRNLWLSILAIIFNQIFKLTGFFLIGIVIDRYIQFNNYNGLILSSVFLLVVYLVALFTSYFHTKTMGEVGIRLLFVLRKKLFEKLQELPVSFFNTNKTGELISRVNSDSDKLNAFFSHSILQFMGCIAMILGASSFLLIINFELGIVALLPSLLIVLVTYLIYPLVKKYSKETLSCNGNLNSQINESLKNFKVIVSFNRRDYFRREFSKINRKNYVTSLKSGLTNGIFQPTFDFFSNLAQLMVLVFGVFQISNGTFAIGSLISYLIFTTQFYISFKILAILMPNFQLAMAGWDRINQILMMDSDLKIKINEEEEQDIDSSIYLHMKNVFFKYSKEKEILNNITLRFKRGKTYAFVGPTGGGKTTLASLTARLYDPTDGKIYLEGRDLKTYSDKERAQKIGFILQEPFLFTGTVRENILYGNEKYLNYTDEQLRLILNKANLRQVLGFFTNGLETKFSASNDNLSFGQKQLVAFVRAILREPELLIMDEATANIDTRTEKLIEGILSNLSKKVTKIIIAHRLNTIRNSDEIYYVNLGKVTPMDSIDTLLVKLELDKRMS